MEIRQLRTFCSVASLLSFNLAAKRLHYAQSSVSAQIQALEEELDVKLFDRLGRRILLTDAGSRLLEYAEKILDLADETIADLANENTPSGTLTIRVPETFAVHRLPPILKRFHQLYPKVRLRFTTCAYEGLQKDLRKGIINLAFLLTDSIIANDLKAEAVGVESLVIVAHPDNPLNKQKSVQTKDLAKETLILSKVDCAYRRLFQEIIDRDETKWDTILELNSVAAIKHCIMEGIGITIIPRVAVEKEISRGQLAIIPWSEGEIEIALLMIQYKEKWISPTMKAFMNVVREVLGDLKKRSYFPIAS